MAAEPSPHLGGVIRVRAGRHACFDRFVLDLDSPGTGWNVQYVDEVITPDPHDDETLDPRGGAQLMISLSDTEYAQYTLPYKPGNPGELVDVEGWQTFRQVAFAGEFEYYYIFGLGVRARLPFRAFWLDGPGESERLVVDVAHRW